MANLSPENIFYDLTPSAVRCAIVPEAERVLQRHAARLETIAVR